MMHGNRRHHNKHRPQSELEPAAAGGWSFAHSHDCTALARQACRPLLGPLTRSVAMQVLGSSSVVRACLSHAWWAGNARKRPAGMGGGSSIQHELGSVAAGGLGDMPVSSLGSGLTAKLPGQFSGRSAVAALQ
jgi:hypothetical protein